MAKSKIMSDEAILHEYSRQDGVVGSPDGDEVEYCRSCGKRIQNGETFYVWAKKAATYNTPRSELSVVLCERDDGRLRNWK